MVLSSQEDQAFTDLSLARFRALSTVRLDWRRHEVLERHDAFEAGQLRVAVLAHADPGELAIVFWGILAVPSIALGAELLADNAEAVEDVGAGCWVHLTDSGLLIEYRDGEGLTVGRVPD